MVLHVGHVLLVEGQLGQPWPFVQLWGASDLEYLCQLVQVVLACEKRRAIHDFCEDAPDGPDINRGRVILRAKQNVRRSIPQSHDLMSKVLNWDTESTGETEISQFEQAFAID